MPGTAAPLQHFGVPEAQPGAGAATVARGRACGARRSQWDERFERHGTGAVGEDRDLGNGELQAAAG